MHKHTLGLLIAASMLTACAHGLPPTPMTTPALNPPAQLTDDCPDLPPPQDGRMTNLLSNHVQVAKLYHKCRERLRGLAQWIKDTK